MPEDELFSEEVPGLSLRRLRPDDAPALSKLYSSPETMEHLQFMRVDDPNAAVAYSTLRIERRLAEMKERRGVFFVIKLADSSDVVGHCSFSPINRLHRWAEFGIILSSRHWGKNLGFASSKIALDWIFLNLPIDLIEMRTKQNNARSIALLERLGCSKEATLRDRLVYGDEKHSVEVFSIVRTEWRRRRE